MDETTLTMSLDSNISSFDNICENGEDASITRSTSPNAPIIIFGSQGSDFLPSFEVILVLARRHSELSAFLTLALKALRSELQSVANRHLSNAPTVHTDKATQRQSEVELLAVVPPFEPFSDLKTLVDFHQRTGLRDPVINGVLLCFLHTASVVAVYCAAHRDQGQEDGLAEPLSSLKAAWAATSQPHSHLLGFCTGALSALASRQSVQESSQFNLWEYFREAARAIRICFWISLRSAQAGVQLGGNDSTPHSLDHWSIVVAVKEADNLTKVYECLSQFNEIEQLKPLDKSVPLVITAKAAGQLSIGGLPRDLERFKAHLLERFGSGCVISPLHIFSPYHSPALQGAADMALLDLESRGLVDDGELVPSQKFLWETASAKILAETKARDALRVLIDSNLCSTADWDAMIENLNSVWGDQPQTDNVKMGRIVSFGPGTNLAADLRRRLCSHNNLLNDTTALSILDVPSLLRQWSTNLVQGGPNKYAQLAAQPDVHGDEVVIVSMACRFPGDVRNPEQLWTCLETGRSTATEIPKHLFDIDAYYGDGLNQTMARHMHALPENVVKSMDARLFSMSPKEIEQLDPQHRLVMLCSYEALERAGYSPDSNSPSSFDRKRILVCMGAAWDDYRENASCNIGSYFITGNIRAFIPGHISFSLKWEGPSVSVDSLECSAVTAIQWSRRALLSGQCDVALAGAVNVLTQPQMFIAMDKEGILSHSGTNATFSSKLDGKTRGDGCGVLLLKRRSTAIQDGDKILATLPAARTTYHGQDKDQHSSSLTQHQFMAQVMSEACVRPSELVHIEASGYHTKADEAAEFDAFAQLMTASKAIPAMQDHPISVASSRPNIGAGEAVSAMASVMKAVLILEKGTVPRQISISHPSELQSRIAATCAKSPLFVPTQASLLPPMVHDRRSCILVNSLASTGCHGVVLVGAPTGDEKAVAGARDPRSISPRIDSGAWVFLLSAKTKESGEMLKKSLIDYLQREVCLRDLSYSLACRRTHHPFRLAVIASEQDDLIRRLRGASFVEAKQATELLPFKFQFDAPPEHQLSSMQALFGSILGLQERYNELKFQLTLLGDYGSHKPESDMQGCLARLMKDCGIHEHDLAAKEMVSPPKDWRWIRISDSVEVLDSKAIESANQTVSRDAAELHRELLSTLCKLHEEGYAINWIEYFRPYLFDSKFIETLPTYAFHLQQHWMEYHDRNLLRPKIIEDDTELNAVTESEGAGTDSTHEALTQPLLSVQVTASPGLRVYKSNLADETQAAVLKFSSCPGLAIELVYEAIHEVVGSNIQQDSRPVLCLSDIQLVQAGRAMLDAHDVTISVKFDDTMEKTGSGSVTIAQEMSELGTSGFRWLMEKDLQRQWSKLGPLVLDKMHKIMDDGELLHQRLIYKTIQSETTESSRSILKVNIAVGTKDVVFRNQLHLPGASVHFDRQCVLPALLSTLEDCARWYNSTFGMHPEAGTGLAGIEEMVVRREWLEESMACGRAEEYLVFVSPTHVDEPNGTNLAIDMLLFTAQGRMFGHLLGVEMGKIDAQPKKTVAKSADRPPALAVNAPETNIPSSNTKKSAQESKPRAAAKQPAMPKKAGRATELYTKVLDVLASELGISVDEMGPSVKFADLGLDSLMSLVCISTLEGLNLGFEIPQSLFMEKDSPGELLAWIREQVGSDGNLEPESEPDSPDAESEDIGDDDVVDAPAAVDQTVSVPETQVFAGGASGNSAVDEAMKTITETIETELGVAEGSLEADANLADLGMDSLMSLLVLGNLSTAGLPCELPSSLFMDCSSLCEIRTFLATKFGPSPNPPAPTVSTVPQTGPEVVTDFVIPPPKPPVLLHKGTNPTSDHTPLFLLPDGSGMSTVYQFFPPLDRALYSINSPFLADASAWRGGITQIAHYYLSCIRLVQPKGPWLVGGWSFGGMAAFEIARILPGEVAGVFLLDSPCPATYPPLPMSIVDWICTAPEVADIAPPTLSPRLIKHFQATVDSLVGYNPAGKEVRVKVWYIVANQPLPGKIEELKEVNETVRWLFRGERGKDGADGWERCVKKEMVKVEKVEGANHFTMVREPNTAKLVDILQRACHAALSS